MDYSYYEKVWGYHPMISGYESLRLKREIKKEGFWDNIMATAETLNKEIKFSDEPPVQTVSCPGVYLDGTFVKRFKEADSNKNRISIKERVEKITEMLKKGYRWSDIGAYYNVCESNLIQSYKKYFKNRGLSVPTKKKISDIDDKTWEEIKAWRAEKKGWRFISEKVGISERLLANTYNKKFVKKKKAPSKIIDVFDDITKMREEGISWGEIQKTLGDKSGLTCVQASYRWYKINKVDKGER